MTIFRVAFVIPTFNRAESLRDCLRAIFRSDSQNFEVIVVDDGSSDSTQAMLASEFSQVLVVPGDGQLWWSGCICAGADRARAEGRFSHLLFLNDDVQVADHYAEALAQVAQELPESMVGSLISFANDPESIWCAGGRINWLTRGAYMDTRIPQSECWRVDWLPGMGSLVPLHVYDLVGGVDARVFPQYFGDTDFSLRVGRAGVPVLCHRSMRLVNQVDSTGILLPSGGINLKTAWAILSDRRSHSNIPTRLRFWLRHCPFPLVPWQASRYYAPLLAAMARKVLVRRQ